MVLALQLAQGYICCKVRLLFYFASCSFSPLILLVPRTKSVFPGMLVSVSGFSPEGGGGERSVCEVFKVED